MLQCHAEMLSPGDRKFYDLRKGFDIFFFWILHLEQNVQLILGDSIRKYVTYPSFSLLQWDQSIYKHIEHVLVSLFVSSFTQICE